MKRFLRHSFTTKSLLKKTFPKKTLESIELVIGESEKRHSAQVCFSAEASLSVGDLFRQKTSRERALEVFSLQRVWDTEDNSGVLLYLLLADKKIEIIADRGISRKVESGIWVEICKHIEENFKKGWFEKGIINGISEITEILETYFPRNGKPIENELSDAPTLL